MDSATTIIASIDTINREIERHRAEITKLEAARETLGQLVSVDEAKAIRRKQREATTPQVLKVTDKAMVEESTDEGRPVVTIRRSTKKSSSGNGNGSTRRDQIIALLAEGNSPREVADELGIAPNYVYHVKRSLNGNDAPAPKQQRAKRAPKAKAKMTEAEAGEAFVKSVAKQVKANNAKRATSKATQAKTLGDLNRTAAAKKAATTSKSTSRRKRTAVTK